ncbi:MAG: hypothetical protein QXU93_09075, partial [Thermoproteus sp.]
MEPIERIINKDIFEIEDKDETGYYLTVKKEELRNYVKELCKERMINMTLCEYKYEPEYVRWILNVYPLLPQAEIIKYDSDGHMEFELKTSLSVNMNGNGKVTVKYNIFSLDFKGNIVKKFIDSLTTEDSYPIEHLRKLDGDIRYDGDHVVMLKEIYLPIRDIKVSPLSSYWNDVVVALEDAVTRTYWKYVDKITEDGNKLYNLTTFRIKYKNDLSISMYHARITIPRNEG